MSFTYSFDERMGFSCAAGNGGTVDQIIMSKIPNAVSIRNPTSMEDRNGTDKWVTLACGDEISVDIKIRSRDHGDIALETWSVMKLNMQTYQFDYVKIGWTLDINKRTDYILFYWKDTERYFLAPFPILCSVFNDYHLYWKQNPKKVATQETNSRNGSYYSECVFVPTDELSLALADKMGWTL